ncbi:hypothetical protein F5Y00DRAFT_26590 [Daldinia vernicosa]|uniref:uncharacterized protein n=1 Tax=Daldinia vernicosa TaxID=114800 RepID=UPI002008033F|nr:uncharacterized protein F5Y00DRAFT_26590 [Daldinia vernicosa]KAI0851087.1 hypothetical protein F5Y00DRAFT_26590 [Daldinia vernicosa]
MFGGFLRQRRCALHVSHAAMPCSLICICRILCTIGNINIFTKYIYTFDLYRPLSSPLFFYFLSFSLFNFNFCLLTLPITMYIRMQPRKTPYFPGKIPD